MSNVKHCGRYGNRVSSCSRLTTEDACRTIENPKRWAADSGDGGAHLCYWDAIENECKDDGEHCAVPCAPFVLDTIGLRGDGPTKCENLNPTNCHYFRNSDNRRCVVDGDNCVSPTNSEPVCKGMGDHFDPSDTAYSARCPTGTKESCATICKNAHSYYTGPATEILNYPCYGFWSYGNERYCQCSS
jgi:hypothetical protein